MSSILYAAFDVVPGPKGAAVHIEQFARGLAGAFDSLHLVTVSTGERIETRTLFPNVEQVQIPAYGDNLIARVMHFRQMFSIWMAKRMFDVIHIRSPYEGLWLAHEKERYCKTLVYEVNGMPSIELKYRYPAVAGDDVLLQKLFQQEQTCLDAADVVITTCEVSRKYLEGRSVPPGKILVIPNGVDLDTFKYASPHAVSPDQPLELIYFGTLAAWQGLEVAIRAVGLSQVPAKLTLIGPASESRIRTLKQQAQSYGKFPLTVLPPMPQQELVAQLHRAHAILAPLTANDRNLAQGCCPLKVLEGMATGTPVIASDLAVVRELADESCLIFAKPGAAGSWKEKIEELAYGVHDRANLSLNARRRVEEHYTWERATKQLIDCYTGIFNNRAIASLK